MSKLNGKDRIVLVHTPCPELNDDRLEPPLGITYLATMLKHKGITSRICDLSSIPEEKWLNYLGEPADIYAFSTYSVNYHRTLQIRNKTKLLNPSAITIAGGPHVSSLPQGSSDDFEIIITGEADLIFVDIIKSIQAGKKIKGIFPGSHIDNLDLIPFPDYELVDLSSYTRIVEGLPSISLITSRGCPYQCRFCNSLVFSRGQLRFRSPENVVQQIKELHAKYGTTNFRFSDDLFTFSQQRIIEMCAALKPLNIIYRIFARSNSMTPEACRLLYESGCRHVAIGIETMSEKMLRLYNKQVTVQTNIEAMRNAKSAGLKVRIYLLIGFPGETEATIQESLNILLDCDFDEFIVYPFIPYPGTAVWMNPEQWGATIDRDFSKYIQVGSNRQTCYAVTTADFTPEIVKNWRDTIIDALEQKVSWADHKLENK